MVKARIQRKTFFNNDIPQKARVYLLQNKKVKKPENSWNKKLTTL